MYLLKIFKYLILKFLKFIMASGNKSDSGSSSGSGSNGYVVVDKFPNNAPETAEKLEELEKYLESNKISLLQFNANRKTLQDDINRLDTKIKSITKELNQFKEHNPGFREKELLKQQGIEILKKIKRLEYTKKLKEKNLNLINNTITTLLTFRKKIKNQLPKLKGGGVGSSKPKQEYDELTILIDISKLLLKQTELLIKIYEIDDKLPIDETELTDEMKKLIIEKHQLEKEKLELDAKIEFMEEEIYTKEEKAEMRGNAEEEETNLAAELEAELNALLAEGDKGSQTGGKRKTKKRNNKTKKHKTNKSKKDKTNTKKKTQKRKP